MELTTDQTLPIDLIKEAEEFVMDFYEIDKDILDQYYQDELQSALKLIGMK